MRTDLSGAGAEFQSTPPARGATHPHWPVSGCHGVSIHAPRAGSDSNLKESGDLEFVSIHAPRAGSDVT